MIQALIRLFTYLILLAAVAGAGNAHAQTAPVRIALVIGNSDYDLDGFINPDKTPQGMQPDLRNAANDAGEIAKKLVEARYKVTLRKNADYDTMQDAITTFAIEANKLPEGSVALIYYAGHGLSIGGANYLIPAGAKLPQGVDFGQMSLPSIQFDMRRRAIAADELLDVVTSKKGRVVLVIIDRAETTLGIAG